MKKAFLSLLIGFGATLAVFVAVTMPPGSWAVIAGVGLAAVILLPAMYFMLKAMSMQGQALQTTINDRRYERDAYLLDRENERRGFNADRRHERTISTQWQQEVAIQLQAGTRVGQLRNGEDIIQLPNGQQYSPGELNIEPEELEYFYQEQTKFLPRGRSSK